ncbi:MAG TPA: hypothetical protein VHE30_23100, partial [Polyangiaceae bacterium]|nr:hypothetical protein [Polyangiaceae bacterium]
LVSAANRAVREGRADSVSGWVSGALAERAERERRLAAMADAVRAYEAEFGVISEAEIAAQELADRRGARRPARSALRRKSG